MIDTTNKEQRFIMTPQGLGEIRHFVETPNGIKVCVYLEKKDKRSKKIRESRMFNLDECEELNE